MARGVPDLEYTALKMLIQAEKREHKRGVSIWLVGLNPDVLIQPELDIQPTVTEMLSLDEVLPTAVIRGWTFGGSFRTRTG